MVKRVVVAALIPIMVFTTLVVQAGLLEPRCMYVLAGYAGWVGVSGSGTVYAYDMDGYLHILKPGKNSIVSRIGPVARGSTGHLLIAQPPLGDYILYVVSGDTGQILNAVGPQGDYLWSSFIPGQVMALAVSPGGDRVAVAYREPQPPPGQLKVVVEVIEKGKRVNSFALTFPGITEAKLLSIAVSDNGRVAVYMPGAEELRVYGENGVLEWRVSTPGVPELLCMSRQGDLVAAAVNVQGGVILESYSDGEELASIPLGAARAALSPDCTHAVAAKDSSIFLASLVTGERRNLTALPRVSVLSISSQGEYILAAGGYSFYIISKRGTVVGNGYTLDQIQNVAIGAGGSPGVIVDDKARLYCIENPEAEHLSLSLKLLALGIVFVAGLILLLRISRSERRVEEAEDEEIFP